MTTLEGGCLCGKVRFKAHKPPVRTFACHCTFCQRVTGSAFYAESIFEVDSVEFNAGELSKYEHVSDNSQKKVVVEFCPNCGTTIGLTFERWPTMRAISRGCYDNPAPSTSQATSGPDPHKPVLFFQLWSTASPRPEHHWTDSPRKRFAMKSPRPWSRARPNPSTGTSPRVNKPLGFLLGQLYSYSLSCCC